MNKIALIFLIFVTLSCAEKKSIDKKESNKEINKTGLPEILFDSEMHDFGRIKSGEILAYSYVFKNAGKSDLIIDKAEADCSCIQVTIPKKNIPPGKKGIIEVVFNSGGMIGKQLKTVEIQSNSKEPKHLIIFAEVENEQIEITY